MTRDETVTLIQALLSGLTGLEDNIITMLKAIQLKLEARPIYPWFLIKSVNVIVPTSGQLTVPADFLKEYDDDEGAIFRDDGAIIMKTRRAAFNQVVSIEGPAPKVYDLINTTMYFYPLPADPVNATLWYYGRDATLDTNIENGWLREANYLMMCEALFMMAQNTAQGEIAKLYVGLMQEALVAFEHTVVERREANLRSYFGKRQ